MCMIPSDRPVRVWPATFNQINVIRSIVSPPFSVGVHPVWSLINYTTVFVTCNQGLTPHLCKRISRGCGTG